MQAYTWIYSLEHEISAETLSALQAAFDAFLRQWKSHGVPVDGMIQLRHHRFVIIQSDPADDRPSGCSIDSLKRAIGQILEQHHLKVQDAAYVQYRDAEGQVQSVHFQQLPSLVKEGKVGPQTMFFDHSLGQSDDLSKWEMPMQETWLKRFLPVVQ